MNNKCVPLLKVENVNLSIKHYNNLGFVVSQQWPEDSISWCLMSFSGIEIMLQKSDNKIISGGIDLYCNVDDAYVLMEEMQNRGVSISEVENAFYGLRQFLVIDPDGHEVWFQSPQKS